MWFLLAFGCVDGQHADPDQLDADGDGYPASADCNDDDPDVHPDAHDEPYDDVDADCSGGSDSDVDGDGYDAGEGAREDCDDTDPDINPDAEEHCDDVDEDCNGQIDENAVDSDRWYRDGDADGYGGDTTREACADPGVGWERTSTDCDDGDAEINPGAEEVMCSGTDDNCDGDNGHAGVIGPDGTIYASFAAALGAAVDGQTVTVCEGVLVENAVVDRAVTIEAMPGARIVGAGSGAVLAILADATVRGLDLSRGTGWEEGRYTFGGLVHVAPGISATLEDVHGRDGSADFGGCVSVGSWGRLTLVDASFERCAAGSLGGVLYAQDSTVISFDGVILANGDGGTAGGVFYLGPAGVASLTDTTLQLGAASLGGGAYLGAGASVHADAESTVEDSDAEFGGGLFLSETSHWSGGIVRQNSASSLGGGIYIPNDERDIVVEDTNVRQNNASWGGGIAVSGGVTLLQVNIDDNEATTGGGFYIMDASATMEGGSCTGNESLLPGGGAAVLSASWWATLTVTGSDWGTGSRNNQPDDVYAYAVGGDEHTRNAYGTNATFTCGGSSGC